MYFFITIIDNSASLCVGSFIPGIVAISLGRFKFRIFQFKRFITIHQIFKDICVVRFIGGLRYSCEPLGCIETDL